MGDGGLLRVTDVRPSARSAGVSLGDLVLAFESKPMQTPCTVPEFERICPEEPPAHPAYVPLRALRWGGLRPARHAPVGVPAEEEPQRRYV